MRRAALAVLVATAAPAVGCGTGFDQEKETVRPLKVAHALGETKVPGQARRPLPLTAGALDATLALGVRPVATTLPGGRLPGYLRAPGAGLKVEPPLQRGDLARAEALDPDLIIGGKQSQGRLYDELSDIAPTVLSDSGEGDWKLDLRLFGEALGRTNAAEQLLIDWDGTAARARRALRGSRGSSVAVVRVVHGGLRVAGADSFAGRVLADAGLEVPATTGALVSLRAVDADVYLVSSAPGAPARPDVPGAVRVDDSLWWEGDGILAARAATRDLERVLAH